MTFNLTPLLRIVVPLQSLDKVKEGKGGGRCLLDGFLTAALLEMLIGAVEDFQTPFEDLEGHHCVLPYCM